MFSFLKNETKKLTRFFFNPAFLYITLVGNTVLFTLTTIVYFVERNTNPTIKNYFDSLWWGIATITTIGYGDVIPHTVIGRLCGMVLMISGPVLFITSTSVLVTLWLKQEVEREITPLQRGIQKEEKEQIRLEKMIEEIKEKLDKLSG